MDFEEPFNKVEFIHKKLESMVGGRLKVRANMGRSRIVEREGTLLQAHGSLFVVEVDERRGRKARQSYQYVDVLTGTVELSYPQDGSPLFTFIEERPDMGYSDDSDDEGDDD
ncbi:MAG: Veg family protein [Coriobacteriales bacterium]|nr:Veg family protein [Coriobacteriales bacterium]